MLQIEWRALFASIYGLIERIVRLLFKLFTKIRHFFELFRLHLMGNLDFSLCTKQYATRAEVLSFCLSKYLHIIIYFICHPCLQIICNLSLIILNMAKLIKLKTLSFRLKSFFILIFTKALEEVLFSKIRLTIFSSLKL